jgi:hypothetical protein
MDAHRVVENVSPLRYWNTRIQAKINEILSPLNNKRYMLPLGQGNFPANCYNYATYPRSIGLPTSVPSGRSSDNP